MTGYVLEWPWVLERRHVLDDLLDKMRDTRSDPDRLKWLEALEDAARSADPDSVERYAIGLTLAERYTQSLRFWRVLVNFQPESVQYRLNLAACLLSAERFDESAHVMSECARRCHGDDPLRPLVDRRMADLERVREATEREWRLLELKADAFQELVAQGRAGLAELKQFARTLGALARRPHSAVTPGDLAAVVELIRAEAYDVEALEIIAWALMLANDHDGLADALRELERAAPDSAVLAAVRSEETDPGFRRGSDELKRRWEDIVERASHCEPGAEDELRRELQQHPHNEELRVGLLFAVYGRAANGEGNYEEARQLALELAADPKAGRHTHFHVAQFLWSLGETKRSLDQFALAFETSESEESRESVRLAMRTVGAEPTEGRRG